MTCDECEYLAEMLEHQIIEARANSEATSGEISAAFLSAMCAQFPELDIRVVLRRPKTRRPSK